jgi:hypothetical protein
VAERQTTRFLHISDSGAEMATQTTTVMPPAYQLPYLQYGLGQAKQLYQDGAQVVPFSPQTEQALQGTAQRAQTGSPLVQSAQDYTQKVLQGGFLGSNPFLDQTFEMAANRTQNRLASEFARSGRNVGASQGTRTTRSASCSRPRLDRQSRSPIRTTWTSRSCVVSVLTSKDSRANIRRRLSKRWIATSVASEAFPQAPRRHRPCIAIVARRRSVVLSSGARSGPT